MNFKTWKELKKVKNSDLAFVSALKTEQEKLVFEKLADQMALLEPSFSEGLAFLETGVELLLMGHLETLFEDSADFGRWKDNLRKLRYPHSTDMESQAKSKLEKLPWPSQAKLKFERRGDKFGVEVRFFVSQPTDLVKVVSALERVQVEMKENS